MFLIDTNRQGQVVTDAVVNQSIDNYLVNDLKLPGHGLMMYVNRPAVIVGINQNVTARWTSTTWLSTTFNWYGGPLVGELSITMNET